MTFFTQLNPVVGDAGQSYIYTTARSTSWTALLFSFAVHVPISVRIAAPQARCTFDTFWRLDDDDTNNKIAVGVACGPVRLTCRPWTCVECSAVANPRCRHDFRSRCRRWRSDGSPAVVWRWPTPPTRRRSPADSSRPSCGLETDARWRCSDQRRRPSTSELTRRYWRPLSLERCDTEPVAHTWMTINIASAAALSTT